MQVQVQLMLSVALEPLLPYPPYTANTSPKSTATTSPVSAAFSTPSCAAAVAASSHPADLDSGPMLAT